MQRESGQEHAVRPQNKTLVRGLTVLSTIEALGRARLTTIARETGLPKPTVSRLLQTLSEQGYVRDLGMRQGFASMRACRTPCALDGYADLLAVWTSIVDAVITKIKFPTCLAVVDVPHVDFIPGSSDVAPFHLTDEVLRKCATLTGSAAGIAYLATLPEQKRREILSDHPVDIDDVERACVPAQERGFAFTNHDDVAPGLRAIAVSVHGADDVIGSITTHFVNDYVTDRQLTTDFYPELQRASKMLSDRCVGSLACR